VRHRALVHHHHRRLLAAAHAGDGLHLHIALPVSAQALGQRGQQFAGAGHAATEAVAHAQHQARGLGILAAHDLKVVIETGHLIHLGHGQIHLPGQRHQVAIVQHAEVVVQAVQVFDEQIAPKTRSRAWAQPLRHLGHGSIFGLAALEAAGAAQTGAQVVRGGESDSRGLCRSVR